MELSKGGACLRLTASRQRAQGARVGVHRRVSISLRQRVATLARRGQSSRGGALCPLTFRGWCLWRLAAARSAWGVGHAGEGPALAVHVHRDAPHHAVLGDGVTTRLPFLSHVHAEPLAALAPLQRLVVRAALVVVCLRA